MNRPRLLDLFCGAGGAAMGYHRAGFDITGVDINPQPHYPFTFVQADAMTYPLDGYQAIHASPPCQDHTTMGGWRPKDHGTGWMLPATIDRLTATGIPWVVENVPAADMPGAMILCARALGLSGLRRHRLFESNILLLSPGCACDNGPTYGIYGDHGDKRPTRPHPDGARRTGKARNRDHAAQIMGIDWMPWRELAQAIPPAYTEHIGWQLLNALAVTP